MRCIALLFLLSHFPTLPHLLAQTPLASRLWHSDERTLVADLSVVTGIAATRSLVYAATLGGLDAVAFAGGIGENAAVVRERTVSGLEGLGLRLDRVANQAARGLEAEISSPGSPVRIFVVPTNEELLIARDTWRIVSGAPAPA